jgi:elongation factor Ts
MAGITPELIKQLRERTGAGFMDCKRALEETSGDLEKAVLRLREKGLAAAAKKAGRTASEGLIYAYIHPGGRIGAMVEVNCETDFVARTEEFAALAKDIAMQVAASQPRWVRREDVPAEEVERERAVLLAQARSENKPERVIQQMVEGRLRKFYAEWCLLEQPFIRDPEVTVGELVRQAVARLGENIEVRRFVRFALGESAGS